MLNRRDFAGLFAASLSSPLLANAEAAPAQPGTSAGAGIQTSVMLWALNKFGTFDQNLETIAKAGYKNVQLVGEFKKWSEEDYIRILARTKALGLTFDATAGISHGFADPAGGDAFIEDVKAIIPIAKRLGCRQLIFVSGKRVDGAVGQNPDKPELSTGPQHQACIDSLKRAAPLLVDAGLVGLLEPIDRLENPPIYLDGVTEAFAIVKAVDHPAIKVLYDLYHEQRSHGNLIEKLEQHIADVALIHVADVPGRHEPGSGEMNYPNIYRKLVELKYKGMIAMEFYPTGDPVTYLRTAREQLERAFS
jgi:hydroxypyruvate isomerase